MKTLLDMVQGILSSSDGDNINSIFDTEESEQVANSIRDSYEHLVTSTHFESTAVLLQLNSSTDNERPVIMTIDEEIDHIDYIKYDRQTQNDPDPTFHKLRYLSVDDFLRRVNKYFYENNDPFVKSFDLDEKFNSLPMYYYTDRWPEYFTLLDNKTLLFDAIDLEVDDTLQNSKIEAYGILFNDFKFEDGFTFPNLTRANKLLIYNEAKRQFSLENRQIDNPLAAKRVQTLNTQRQKNSRIGNYQYGYNDNYPNYSRRGSYGLQRWPHKGHDR